MKQFLILAIAFMFAACASTKQGGTTIASSGPGELGATATTVTLTATPTEESSSGPIGQLIERDLTNARDVATAGGDTVGAQCWTDILALHNRDTGITLHGIASGIEATRLASKDTLMEKTRNDCAAVLFDLKLALLKFGLIIK